MTDTTTEANGRIRDGYAAARETVTQAYDRTRDVTHQALDTTRETASDAARRTAQGIEANPIGILVGGLAFGVIAGALIPRSSREKALLAPLGARIGETTKAATQAARDAGMAELGNLGLTKDAARDQVKTLFEGVVKAVSTAGTAAAKSATAKSEA